MGHDNLPLMPGGEHDHKTCLRHALNEAEHFCKQHGLRLTELRRHILELVWASHKPVGAYALLEQLTKEGHNAAPPTVYRSLDFLLSHRLIHRIASLNAYIGCSHPGKKHRAQFFICERCGEATELHGSAIERAIAKDASNIGFAVSSQIVEIAGTCAECAQRDQP